MSFYAQPIKQKLLKTVGLFLFDNLIQQVGILYLVNSKNSWTVKIKF
jgi:hypothetical protein